MITNSIWHRWMVGLRGRRDGKKNDPPPEAVKPSQLEASLAERGNQHLAQIYGRARDRDEKLQGQQEQAQKRFEYADQEYQKTSARYEAKKQALGRDVIVHFPRALYVILLLLLILGEFPFNAVVFRVFEEAEILTIVMAVTVALAIPISAHFIGIMVRHWAPPWWRTGLYVLISIAVVVGGLFALNYVRGLYVASQSEALGQSTAREGIEYAYFAINLLVFFVALIASFFAHDEDQEIEKLRAHTLRLAARRDAAQTTLSQVKAARDALLQKSKGQAEEVMGIIRELVRIYRRANTHRRSQAAPPCFHEEPAFRPLVWWDEQTPGSAARPQSATGPTPVG
jgi:hypothetical protein